MPDASTRPPYAAWLDQSNDVTRTFLSAGSIEGLINLGGGLPEPDLYPVDEIAALTAQAFAEHPGDCLNYAPIEGLPALRDAIAARFSDDRLHLRRENVLIVSGGMQALDLLGKCLVDPGAKIAVQDPTYVGALDAWRPRAPMPSPFRPIDDDLRLPFEGARFAYTVPNFSNPTGKLVDEHQRVRLIDAARIAGTWLVEDDPYGTLYYDRTPLPRMLSMSAEDETPYGGPVIYMGTLSKELSPGLRVGWIIAAPDMIQKLTLAKQGSDLSSSGLSQRIALGAMDSGLLDTVRPRILSLYRERRDALISSLERHLSDWFTWEVPEGGMFVWVRATENWIDTDRLLRVGLDHLVCISPSSVFDPGDHDRSGMRLNFTANGADRLEEAVRRLAGAVAEMAPRKRRAG